MTHNYTVTILQQTKKTCLLVMIKEFEMSCWEYKYNIYTNEKFCKTSFNS